MEKYFGYTSGEDSRRMIQNVKSKIQTMENSQVRIQSKSYLTFAIEGAKELIAESNNGDMQEIIKTLKEEDV